MKKVKPKKTGKKKVRKETLRRNFSFSDNFKLFGSKKTTPASLYTKDDTGFIGVGDGIIMLSSEKGQNFFEINKVLSDLLTHEITDVKIEFVPKGSNKKYVINRKPPPKTKEELEQEQQEAMYGGIPGYGRRRR